MSVNVGHASNSEYNSKNGTKGDQTGKEVCVVSWNSVSFLRNGFADYIAIHPDPDIREKHAKAIEDGCANKHIGYGQGNRNSANSEAKKVNYILSDIDEDCNTDCSAFQNLAAVAAGTPNVTYGSNGWTTSTMLAALKAAGYKIIAERQYLDDAEYCVRGAIYVRAGSHTVCGLDNGSKAQKTLEKAGLLSGNAGSNKTSSVTSTSSSTSSTKSSTTSTKLTVDGKMGELTTKRAQEVFGTTVDGVISNQLNKYNHICAGILSAEWSSTKKGGSDLVKALQKKIGATVDGYLGPKTIERWQAWLKTTQDGSISNPSELIRAFQMWLNEQ